jgi:hypothetical protein
MAVSEEQATRATTHGTILPTPAASRQMSLRAVSSPTWSNFPEMTVLRAAALGACVLALCACGSSGHKAQAKVVARKSASGRHASATASFKYRILSDASVHVAAQPAQRVKGGWVVSCGAGLYIMSRDSADFARRAPFDIGVRTFAAEPSQTCELVAVATLARAGNVTVELRGRQSD